MILRLKFLFVLLTVALILPAAVLAQTATLTGTVTDASGAVVPATKVTARMVATNATRTVECNDVGVYQITNLTPGVYEVSVEKAGFKITKYAGLELTVAQSLTLDIKLEVTGVVATVEVNADSIAPIELSNAQISNVVERRKINDLPLVTRDPYQLILLSPGVIQSNSSLGGFSVNGSRERNNNFLLDGTDNNDTDVPGIAGGISSINPESTQEFRVITNNFQAEYGRNSGAIIEIVTKSGTNNLHGTAYWFGRYNALAARDYFSTSNEADPFVRNQFGVAVGGPILKDRTFWFGNYDGSRFRTALQNTATVPTTAFKTGIFTFNGNPVDVSTPASPDNLSGLPLDPLMQQILALYPAPNAGSVDDVRGFFRFPSTSKADSDNFTAKIDHRLWTNHNLSGRYTFNRFLDPNSFNAEILPGIGGISTYQRTQGLSLNLTSTFKPTLLNEFRYGANRTNLQFDCTGLNTLNQFGAQDAFGRAYDLALPGISGFGCGSLGDSDGQDRFTGTYTFYDTLTWVKGRHTIKGGGEVRFVYSNSFTSFASRPLANFAAFSNFGVPSVNVDTDATMPGFQPSLLQDMVHMLFGTVAIQTQSQYFNSTAARTQDDLRGFRQRELNFFVQDTFKITQNLTLNYGLRYQVNGVPFEVNNNLSVLLADPSGTAPFTFTIAGPGAAAKLYNNDRNDFEPRIGIAWDPFKRGKTSIRAGYGIFHDRVFGNLLGNARGVPPFQRDFFDFPFTAISVTPAPPPQTASPTVVDVDGIFPVLFDQNFRTPYNQSWNFGVQHEVLPALLVEINYVGSKGTRLFRVVDGNPPQPNLVAQLVTFCSNPNPFNCIVDDLQFSTLYFGFEFGILPFNAVNNNAFFQAAVNKSIANSTYHALQLNVTKRLTRGFQVQGAFTWSHAIDDASDPLAPAAGNRGFPRDSLNLRGERGNSDFDVTRHLVINYLWELPFGRGRTWLRDGVVGKVLEGWQLSGITTFSDGIPFDVFGNVDANHQGLSSRLDRLATPNPANVLPSTVNLREQTGPGREFFDFPAFGTPGNVGRNRFRGPGIANYDMVLSKDTAITERLKLVFRTEFFNLFNRVQFAQPDNQWANTKTFGLSTSQVGRPDGTSGARQVQFALKLQF